MGGRCFSTKYPGEDLSASIKYSLTKRPSNAISQSQILRVLMSPHIIKQASKTTNTKHEFISAACMKPLTPNELLIALYASKMEVEKSETI